MLCVGLGLVTASCSFAEAPSATPTTMPDLVVATLSPVVSTNPPPSVPMPDLSTTTTAMEMPSPTKTTTVVPAVDPEMLDDISMTSVPKDVIVPSDESSLDNETNPINGRRGARRPLADDLGCATGPNGTCLTGTLDKLGFDVTTGSEEERERSVQRATAVMQLDAGLLMTGVPDAQLLQYLNIADDPADEAQPDEAREIGTSAEGRSITALRYGDGERTVLVVGQTHGDEEGGLRVLLRAASLSLPDGLTLWVVPTMNPDGLAMDTRFLDNGTDPNRQATSQREQQAVYDFALEVRPSLSIWYHQNYGWVGGSGASMAAARKYQALTGLGTLKHSGDCAKGFMWCPIDLALGSSSILVELPDVLTPADVQNHADALLDVASDGDL
jgi:hypothetical protein